MCIITVVKPIATVIADRMGRLVRSAMVLHLARLGLVRRAHATAGITSITIHVKRTARRIAVHMVLHARHPMSPTARPLSVRLEHAKLLRVQEIIMPITVHVYHVVVDITFIIIPAKRTARRIAVLMEQDVILL